MLISLLSVPTHPVSDYKAIWESAVAMANGDFDVSHLEWSDYMYIYNWQLGISALESLVIRIFGPEFWSIQLLNVLIVNATAMSVYYFAKEVYADNRRTASFTVLILALFWPFVITVNQFTNQHIAALLILIILILLKRDSVKIWVLAGLLLAILNIVRPMAIVLLIAILLYSLWGGLKNGFKRHIWRFCCLFVVFAAAISTVDYAFIRAGYTDSPVSSPKLPWFKFDKGLTGYDAPELGGFDSLEQFNQWEHDKLVDELAHRPLNVAKYVSGKMIRYLGEWDYKFENTYNHDIRMWYKPGVWQLVMFGWGQYVLLMIAAAFGYYGYRRSHAFQLWEIVLLGLIAVYFVIEAFSSYRYESYPLLAVCASSLLNKYAKRRPRSGIRGGA